MAKLTPLTRLTIATCGLAGVALGVGSLWWMWTAGALPAPSLTVAMLAALCAVVGYMALSARDRLRRRRDLVDAKTAVMWWSMARAAILVGVLAVGFFAVWSVDAAGQLHAKWGQERLLYSLLAVGFGVGLAVLGRWLERLCTVTSASEDDTLK